MKADLYIAPVRTAGFGGIAHRTSAGFVVLASAGSGHLIDLLASLQHESELIDQLVAQVRAERPEAFAMLFTAGGDLFLIASGAAVAQVTSASTQLAMSAAAGQVLVHPVSAGIDETAARIRLYTVDPGPAAQTAIDLRAGTIEAGWVDVVIGEPAPVAPAAVAQPLAQPVPQPVAQPVPAPEPAPEPAAIVAPAPEPVAIIPPPLPPALPPEPVPTRTDPHRTSNEWPTMTELVPHQGSIPRPVTTEPAPPKVGAVMVLGSTCSQGHHNHPDAVYCSQCGTRMGVQHTTVLINGPRPPLGVLVVDDGTTYSLNQDMIIGREPTADADVLAGAASPVILTDDTLSLSRRHARITLSDWAVTVTDLNSSNGTWLSRAGTGQNWSKLEAGSPAALEPGDRLRVGGRIIQVELHHLM